MCESCSTSDDEYCWICMGCITPQQPLLRPCACPRLVHGKCLARWQLQKAGQQEETRCRFCYETLPDWRSHLGCGTDASPTMSVEYQGKVIYIKLRNGQRANRASVEQLIKKLFAIPDTQELNLSFECLVPDSDEKVELEGPGAFPAALHCASMTAHRRRLEKGAPSCQEASGESPGDPPPAPLDAALHDSLQEQTAESSRRAPLSPRP